MTRLKGRRWQAFSLLTLVAAWLLAGPALATDRSERIRVGDQWRSYLIHQPERPAPAAGYPLVLAFHGGGMQGAGMQRLTRLDPQADARGVITVYPDGIDRHWNDGRATIKQPQDDVAFIAALIDQLVQHDHVDRRRIYATGLSNGALFVERLGCELSSQISAIAAVAGSLPRDLADACHPARPVAVMQIDGDADPIMPYQGGTVASFGGAGEGGQVLSVAATADAWARHNHCAAAGPAQAWPPTAPLDRTRVEQQDYPRCTSNAPVIVYTVQGGGHAWPGGPQYARPRRIGWVSRQMDASQTIMDFFLSLPPR